MVASPSSRNTIARKSSTNTTMGDLELKLARGTGVCINTNQMPSLGDSKLTVSGGACEARLRVKMMSRLSVNGSAPRAD